MSSLSTRGGSSGPVLFVLVAIVAVATLRAADPRPAGERPAAADVRVPETVEEALARLAALAAAAAEQDKRARGEINAVRGEYLPGPVPVKKVGDAHPPGPGRPPEDPPELVARVKRIQDAIDARVDRVVGEYEQAIRHHPKSWRLRDELASFLYEGHGDEAGALALWLEASDLNPDSADIHNNIGVIQGQCGEPVEALGRFRRAIELEDGKAVYHFNLATTYFSSRHDIIKAEGGALPEIYWKSQAAYEKARELAPGNHEYALSCAQNYFWAHFFGVENTHAKAVMSWVRCLDSTETEHQKAFVYLNLGRVHWKRGHLDVAEEFLLESLKLKSSLATQNVLKRVRQARQARDEG